MLSSASRLNKPVTERCYLFEITEIVAINNIQKNAQLIKNVKQPGFQFAPDDFGTETSSFGNLRNFPVGYLKKDD